MIARLLGWSANRAGDVTRAETHGRGPTAEAVRIIRAVAPELDDAAWARVERRLREMRVGGIDNPGPSESKKNSAPGSSAPD